MKGGKNWYLGTLGAKRRRKFFLTFLVQKTWILDPWEGGLGGGVFSGPTPRGGVWDTPPTTSPPLGLPIEACHAGFYGNGPRGGVVWDPPFNLGGGVVWDTPYVQPLLASHFTTVAQSAQKIFFGPLK